MKATSETGVLARPNSASDEHMLYFIRMGSMPFVKIGVASNIGKRLKALQCASPLPLTIVGSVRGSFSEEAICHKILAKSRLLNEWFEANSALLLLDQLSAADNVRKALEELWQEEADRIRRQQLSDIAARTLLATVLEGLCEAHGASRVATVVGCDPKTIRNARKGVGTLGIARTFNLLDVSPHALDDLFAAKGFAVVPNDNDLGGVAETDIELIATEAENDALLAAALERRSQIALAKLRRSGLAA